MAQVNQSPNLMPSKPMCILNILVCGFTLLSEFLTTKEVANLLRLKQRKVYDLAARNMIPYVKATGKLLFPKTEINQWIQHKGASLAAPSPRPSVILGSHDPLFEWTVTASGCGLPAFLNGSLDGFMRFKNHEGIACVFTRNRMRDGTQHLSKVIDTVPLDPHSLGQARSRACYRGSAIYILKMLLVSVWLRSQAQVHRSCSRNSLMWRGLH